MKIELNSNDLTYFQSYAKEQFQNLPTPLKIPGVSRVLGTVDFVTVCHLRAAVAVLVSKGLLPSDAEVPVNL